MIFKAAEVTWIFGAESSGEAGIEGTLRGPRGPKNIANTHRLHDVLLFFKTSIKNRIVKIREEINKKSHR